MNEVNPETEVTFDAVPLADGSLNERLAVQAKDTKEGVEGEGSSDQ